MQSSFKRWTKSLATTLYDPLSRSVLPIVDGCLRRRFLLRQGVHLQEYRLNGIPTSLYYKPGRQRPPRELPILLIHGIADNALTWAFQMLPLSHLGPVYAIDLPGFGLSGCPAGRPYATLAEMRAVLRACITEVIEQPVLIVGNSLGGWLAVQLAWSMPGMVEGVVLLNPGGACLSGRYSWQPFIDTAQVPDLRTVRQIYRQMFGHVPLLLYLGQRSFQAMFQRDAVQQFIPTFTLSDLLQPDDLRNLPVPAGLIWGLADCFLPAGSMEFFSGNLWNAPKLLLSGCGHLPQRERPRSVVRFVHDFAHSISPNTFHIPTLHDSPVGVTHRRTGAKME